VFNKAINFLSFCEAGMLAYSNYSQNASNHRSMDELHYLTQQLSMEREHSHNLKVSKEEIERKADQYWMILKADGYFYDEENKLSKWMEPEENDENDDDEDDAEILATECAGDCGCKKEEACASFHRNNVVHLNGTGTH
jgi:hypothetical protein